MALLHDGMLKENEIYRFRFGADGLPSGLYLLRAVGKTFTTTRQAMLVR